MFRGRQVRLPGQISGCRFPSCLRLRLHDSVFVRQAVASQSSTPSSEGESKGVKCTWASPRGSWLPPCNGRETEEGHFDKKTKTLSPAYPPFHSGHWSRTLPQGRAMWGFLHYLHYLHCFLTAQEGSLSVKTGIRSWRSQLLRCKA